MIIFDSEEKAIFNPLNLGLVGNPKKGIMIFDDEVWEDYIEKNTELETFPAKNNKGRIFSTFRIYRHEEEDILLICPNIGGAASAVDLELLIASGINKIVAFGTCGAMNKNIAKNTIIIPTSAVREEGVSYHYLAPSDEVDQNKASVKIMEKVFSRHDMNYLSGKVWTTDAVYRETSNKLKTMEQNSCLAVDMEMASLLAVTQFRSVDFAGFLITDDNINGKPSKEYGRDSATLLQLALEIVTTI
jgi:uridine phosphorylase